MTALGKDAVIAVRANGVEAIGRLFEVNVEFTAARDDIDLDALLGTPVTIEVDMAGERSRATTANARFFNGFFSRITYGGFQSEGRPVFRATIVPWLWLLTRRSDCRIFQQKSVREIIEQVFSDAGYSDYRFDLKGSYPVVEYCVQYRETDFQFVSRLMEREGMYYHFTHKNGSHQMEICDDMSCHKPEKNFETLSFIGGSSVADREGVVTDWEYTREVKPGAYAHNDFNFLTPTPDPNLRLLARSTATKPQKPDVYEIYDAPGDYGDGGEGGRYARIRMEELLADRDVASARTNIQGVCAGRKIKLVNHPTKKQNRGYLVTSVHWSVHEGGYGSGGGGGGEFFQCSFTCIPDDGVFRAARITPVPHIDGPQTAIVVGPPEEELHVDEHGRVKVQFPWDREGKCDSMSSCWIRVSQPWAGTGFGGIAIPRINQEVVVEFLEGNPDRPLITGRVYNGVSKPPYALPDHATRTTIKTNSSKGGGGFNELRFEDKKGEEQIFIHGQKNLDVRIRNDVKETNYGNRHERIGWKTEKGSGGSHFVTIREDENTHVEKKHYEMIDEDCHMTVLGEVFENHEKSHKIQVAQDHVLKAQQSIVETSQLVSVQTNLLKMQGAAGVHVLGKQIVLEGTSICLKSGGNFITINPGGVQISGNTVLINSGGAATPAQQPDPAPEFEAEHPFDAKVAVDSVAGGKTRYRGGAPKVRGRGPAVQIKAPPYTPPPGGSPPPSDVSSDCKVIAPCSEQTTVCGCVFDFMDVESRRPNGSNTLEVTTKSEWGDEVIKFEVKEKCKKGGQLKYTARCGSMLLAQNVIHSKPLSLERWTCANPANPYASIKLLREAAPKIVDITFTCSCEDHQVGSATIHHYPSDKATLHLDSNELLKDDKPVGKVVDRVAKHLTKLTGRRFSPREGFVFSSALGHFKWDTPQLMFAYTGNWEEHENGYPNWWKCYHKWEFEAGLSPLLGASVKGDIIAMGGTATGVGAPVVALYHKVRQYVNNDEPLIYFKISISVSLTAFISCDREMLTGGGRGSVSGGVEVGGEINTEVVEVGLAAASNVTGMIEIFGQDRVIKLKYALPKWGGIKGKAKCKVKVGKYFSIGYEREVQLLDESEPWFKDEVEIF